MHRFFAENMNGEMVLLDPEESRHLNKVLRLKNSEQVELFDGSGNLFIAELMDSNPKESVLQVLEKLKIEPNNYNLHLAIAPTKNLNRWEFFLEKATEIGIDHISPIISERSERKVLKRERQLRILKSAVKQSQKLQFPILDEIIPFNQWINQSFEGEKYIAHCLKQVDRSNLQNLHSKGKKALILIGPEGDFSEHEIKIAMDNGFKSVSLSQSRLRTETAAIVACNIIQNINA